MNVKRYRSTWPRGGHGDVTQVTNADPVSGPSLVRFG